MRQLRGYLSDEKQPHPGELRHRIEIGYTESTVNANGYPEPTDIILCRVWASANNARNHMLEAGDAEAAEHELVFSIRYRNDVRVGYWVTFRGERWNITSIGSFGFRNRYLSLRASNVKGVGQQ